MDSPMSHFHFKLTTFIYRFRDLLLPRKKVLKEVGIRPGFHVLDFGCGPGAYIMETAQLVGQSGKIYALDIHPLAIKKVREITSKRNLGNVESILSNCKTDLPDNSVDVVLLYDVFHNLSEPDAVLSQLHRVLKSDGILSFSDHHMKEDEIISKITRGGLFSLSGRGKKTYTFYKIPSASAKQ
ncbi:MAG: class I SAM-dependent methyltransferase [Desulfobacteraceae bacterium]